MTTHTETQLQIDFVDALKKISDFPWRGFISSSPEDKPDSDSSSVRGWDKSQQSQSVMKLLGN